MKSRIYKISLQPNPEKKTKKVMVPEFPALYHPKPKKTKQVEKNNSGNPRTISTKTWKQIKIRNTISNSKDLELYHPKPKKQPGRKLQFQTSRNYKPEKQTENVVHKTSGYLTRPFCIQAAQRTLYIFWSEASVASRQVKPCLGGEMCQSTPRISLCYHGKKQNKPPGPNTNKKEECKRNTWNSHRLWKKDENSAKTQEEIENNTFTWEKIKKHVDEFSGNMSNFKKTNICSKERKPKTHIYIYITNKIFLRTKNHILRKSYIPKKTSLIPQKSEMPKKNKNLLPKYKYSRKNLLSKNMKNNNISPKKCYISKKYIFPKKKYSPKKLYSQNKSYIPQKKVIFPKKKLYSQKNVIFPKKSYIPKKNYIPKKKLYSQKKYIQFWQNDRYWKPNLDQILGPKAKSLPYKTAIF